MKTQHIAFADWSGPEYAAIARSLLLGRVHLGPAAELLAKRLGQMYEPSQVHVLNYGHHAIETALSLFKQERPERTEVIVPAFICPSVVSAVQACGLTVRSVDVQPDLNMSPADVQAALGANTLAVIAPHMYGCPARMVEMEALCGSANVFLIDDAAQVVGVRQDGRLLGTFGDMGVISFAQSKTIVTGIRGSGGVLLVNRPAWAVRARQVCSALPPATGRTSALADFLWNHVGHAYTGHSGYYVARVLAAMGVKAAPPPPATQISNLEAGIALAQLGRLDSLLREKVRIAALYKQAIPGHPLLKFPQFAPGRYLARVMLLLPGGVDMARLRREALSRGVETRSGYAAHVVAGHPAPVSEAMAARLLGVPTRPGMSREDVEGVCSALTTALTLLPRHDRPDRVAS